jgi:hypothetical protein
VHGAGDQAVSIARVRALVVVGLLVVLAAVAAGWAIAKDRQTGASAGGTPCVRGTAPFVTTVPTSARRVRVNVYNATSQVGLATRVAKQLTDLGFTVDQVGNDPLQGTVKAVAEIRYGPAGAGAAQLVRSRFPGAEPTLVTRSDAAVDIVLGMLFEQVATDAVAQQELKRLGKPERPARLC